MSALVIPLLASACGGARNGETTKVATSPEIQTDSSEVLPAPTYKPYTTSTPHPTHTRAPTDAPTTTATPTVEPTHTIAATETPRAPTRLTDSDPGPPLAILVSAIRIKENGFYEATESVRNDSADGSQRARAQRRR